MRRLRRFTFLTILFLLASFIQLSCGTSTTNEGGTGISNPPSVPTSSEAVGVAISALLNISDTTNSLVANLSKRNLTLDGEGDASCNFNFANSPENVVTSTGVIPGIYGTAEESVTLADEDGCNNGGTYLSAVINEHSLSCSATESSFTLTLSSTSSVYTRSNSENEIDLYGTFTISDSDANSYILNCHFVFAVDPATLQTTSSQGQCDDEDGNAIDQTTDYTCVDAE